MKNSGRVLSHDVRETSRDLACKVPGYDSLSAERLRSVAEPVMLRAVQGVVCGRETEKLIVTVVASRVPRDRPHPHSNPPFPYIAVQAAAQQCL